MSLRERKQNQTWVPFDVKAKNEQGLTGERVKQRQNLVIDHILTNTNDQYQRHLDKNNYILIKFTINSLFKGGFLILFSG